ncbi:MAG: hypothetical protein N2595_02855 [bacterium]|nr:hypothetical protein [bacterium]
MTKTIVTLKRCGGLAVWGVDDAVERGDVPWGWGQAESGDFALDTTIPEPRLVVVVACAAMP